MIIRIIIPLFLTISLCSSSLFAEQLALLNLIKKIAHNKLVPLSKEALIVKTVKEANQKAIKTPDEIRKLDEKWKATKGIDEWIGGFLNNPCADYLKKFQMAEINAGESLYSEIFVMDKQGSIVAESDKTSDYWQGDEDKFIKSYNGGKGVLFIDRASFDESSAKYSIQVSVPVFDLDGKKTIGVITVGIDLDVLTREYLS